MSRWEMPRPPGPEIVTQEYLDQLLDQRYRPQPSAVPRCGPGLNAARDNSSSQLEREILRVSRKLDKADALLQKDQKLAQVRGRARHAFGRDR